MSSCPTIAMLEALAAGRSDSGEPSSHIEGCAACRAKLEEIRSNNTLLMDLTAARAARTSRRSAHARTGPTIDDYEILGAIGRGAQGEVYHGIQKATKRRVALKLLLGGAFATPRQRHRFEREVELAAGLRHPNIVTVFDSGITGDGRHFCVMELIAGASLDQFVAEVVQTSGRRPTVNDTLRLFLKICSAVEYAHQRGIIHRDLKPANILIDASTEPRIVDFGLAKDIADDLTVTLMQTQAGEFAGTFAYASPEQTQGQPDLIDTRTDVYALGVILYEMLTGELPYTTSGSLSEVLRAIAEEAPRDPSAIRSEIDHEIETILRKALAKEPDRRYQSAGLLANDIEHYLADEPIDAKRDSAWYMLRKTVRRHRVPVAFALAAVVMLAIFAIAVSIAYRRASVAEARESARSSELAELLSISNIERGRAAGVAGNTALAEELLWREYFAETAVRTFEASVSPARWALRELYARQPCLATVEVPALKSGPCALSADARTVALIFKGSRSIELWDVPTRTRTATLLADRDDPMLVELNADASLLACAWADGAIQLFDLATEMNVAVRHAHHARIERISFSRDGKTLASGDASGVIYLWDTLGFQPRHELRGHQARVFGLAFTPDGALLASSSDDLTVQFWNTSSGTRISTPIIMDRYPVRGLTFSPDGQYLTTSSYDKGISLWKMPSCESRRGLHPLGGAGLQLGLCFSPDGLQLAMPGDRTIPVWNIRSERLEHSLAGHTRNVRHLAYAHDSQTIVSISPEDGTIRRWDTSDAPGRTTLAGHDDTILSASYSPDGTMLATASSDQTIRIWPIGSDGLPTVLKFDSIVQSVAFSSKGVLAAGFNDGQIRIWKNGIAAPPIVWPSHQSHIYSITFSPDGTLIASTSLDQTVRLWDLSTGTCIKSLGETKDNFTAVRFSPDGTLLASGGMTRSPVFVWDVASASLRFSLMGHSGRVRMTCFSPDGRTVASSSDDKTIRLWDLADGRCIATLEGHTYGVNVLSFSADGRLLASAGGGGEVKLWDVERRRFLATMSRDDTAVFGVHLSADARTLTCWGANKLVTVWDLTSPDRCIAGNEDYWRQRLGTPAPRAVADARR